VDKRIDPELSAGQIRELAPAYGEAKAQRTYLEEFKRSKRAMLMKDCMAMGVEAVNA